MARTSRRATPGGRGGRLAALALALAACALAAAACSTTSIPSAPASVPGADAAPADGAPPAEGGPEDGASGARVRVEVTGLVGQGLALRLEAADLREDLPVAAPGDLLFDLRVPEGAALVLSVVRPPLGPRQTCAVTTALPERMPAADVRGVVRCETTALTVGGQITGLAADAVGLELVNGADDVLPIVGGSVSFSFARRLPSGARYDARVAAQPGGQTCTMTRGQGTIGDTDVTDLLLSCE